MKSLFPEKYHTHIYHFALVLLVIGMPTSKFLISVAELTLAGNWIAEGNLKNKFILFWKNKSALLLCSVILLHIIGLLYTTNFADGFLDIRVKAPLFVLPFILSTSKPLTEKIVHIVLKFFVASVVYCTITSALILLDIFHRPVVDVRNISIFISHIRFALLICISFFIAVYFIIKSNTKIEKAIWAVLIVWFITTLVFMESLTGIAILTITSAVILFYKAITSKVKLIKFGIPIVFLCFIAFSISYLRGIMNERNKQTETIDFAKMDKLTSRGNPYTYTTSSTLTENGHLIWIYFCESELREEWNKRSAIKFGENDKKGNPLSYTLTRFLSSKGWRKDADAVTALTTDEIAAIERGVPNVNFQSVSSLTGRIYETLWEIDLYKSTGDANGHSLTQRFEYWKVATEIIRKNLLFGVGTGDVQNSFDEEYVITNSKLAPEWRLHSHNQYLSITVAFGIFGLIWFLASMVYPMFAQRKVFDYLYISFFIIASISFLTEDTLETQAGVTFYAFLNSFLLFARPKDDKQSTATTQRTI